MLNMNRVTLLGHAGRDPEIRTIKSGEKTATFSLATTDKWRRKDGGTGEATEWHRIVVFGAAVAAVEKLVRKGAALLIEGRITTREYRDKKGESRRVTEIVVAGPQGHFNVLSPRRDDGRVEDVEDSGRGRGNRRSRRDHRCAAPNRGAGWRRAGRPFRGQAVMNGRTAFALAALALLAPVLASVPGVSPALAQAPPPAALEAGCDPGIREALAASAARGVEQDLAVIRNPDQGIRDPDSILDFSCLEDLFNYRAFNVLFDPGRALEEILGLAQRRVCEIARNTYRGYVARTLDASVYTSRLPRLPGLHRLPGSIPTPGTATSFHTAGSTPNASAASWEVGNEYPVRCRTAFHAAVLATALTATLAVPPAHAHSPCDPTDNDRAEASRVLGGLTREIDVMEATIVEALRLQTGQLSGYAAQSAKAVTGALDAQTKLQAQIAREVEETRAMRARRPTDSGCAAITGLAGLAATRQAAESAYVRAAGAETGRIAGDRAAVPDAGAAAGNAARFESLTSTYCNGPRAGEDAALCRGG